VRVAILTLGCRANQAESEQIEAHFRASGHSIVDLSGDPELCVINTCSVTSKSDYQSRQLIRRAHKSDAKVVVTGCYSELNRDSVEGMDGVSEVVKNSEKLLRIDELTGNTLAINPSYNRSSKSRFPIKIQDGCNNACSYCIIPKARGRSRSVSIEDVYNLVEEVSPLYSEIILTGIHLGTYGYDLLPNVSLAVLLKRLLKTKIKRIRLSSLEITEITEELLELLGDKRICNHLHIPMQSGDDEILRLMNRPYTVKTFTSHLERIVQKVPNVAIGTDIIVGFPSEGRREFLNTALILETSPIAYAHVFPFSPRRTTRASLMTGRVDNMIKKERCAMLIGLSQKKKTAFMSAQVGKTHAVLLEERSDDGSFIGTTANYLKFKAYLQSATLKDIASLKVVGHDGRFLLGVPIEA